MASTANMPMVVILPGPASSARFVTGRRPRPRVSHQVYVRRRLAVMIAAVAILLLGWFGAATLTNRGGQPASTPTVRQPSAAAVSEYVVEPGDTMWRIAGKYHGATPRMEYVDALVRLNGGVSIDVGQTLRLP